MVLRAVKNASEADVIAVDVYYGPERLLLCSKGTRLSPALVKRLQQYGVVEIGVLGASLPGEASSLSDEEQAAIARNVAQRFVSVRESSFSRALQGHAVRALVARGIPCTTISPPLPSDASTPSTQAVETCSVAAFVDHIEQIPRLSPTYHRLTALIGSDECSAQAVAQLTQSDPGLTLSLLRLANKSDRVRGPPVSTAQQAIVRLGFRSVAAVATRRAVSVAVKQFSDAAYVEMWRHSFAVASVARCLATRFKNVDPEEAFTLGLLHDIGQMLFRMHYHAVYDAVLEMAAATGSVVDTEREAFGIDHQVLGYLLCRRWHLPEIFTQCVRAHHTPDQVEDFGAMAAVVSLAESMATALGLGAVDAEHVGWLGEKNKLVASVSAADWEGVCAESLSAFAEFEEYYGLTFGEAPLPPPAPRAVAAAPHATSAYPRPRRRGWAALRATRCSAPSPAAAAQARTRRRRARDQGRANHFPPAAA